MTISFTTDRSSLAAQQRVTAIEHPVVGTGEEFVLLRGLLAVPLAPSWANGKRRLRYAASFSDSRFSRKNRYQFPLKIPSTDSSE